MQIHKILPFDDAIWRSNENQNPFGSIYEFICLCGWWLYKMTTTTTTTIGAHYVCEWTRVCFKSFAFEICGSDFWVFLRIFNFCTRIPLNTHTHQILIYFRLKHFNFVIDRKIPFNLLGKFSSNNWQVYFKMETRVRARENRILRLIGIKSNLVPSMPWKSLRFSCIIV